MVLADTRPVCQKRPVMVDLCLLLQLSLVVFSSLPIPAALADMPSGECVLPNGTNGGESGLCQAAGGAVDAGGTTGITSTRSDPGNATVPIDRFSCRYVNNNDPANAYFVPFNTAAEWQDFVNNHPSVITLDHCARPTTFTISPDSNCANPSPTQQSVSLPYARYGGPNYPTTVNFTCTGCSAGSPWTEKATAYWKPLDSDTYTPSWSQVAQTSYDDSAKPSCCTPSSSQTTRDCDPTLYAGGTETITTTHNCDGSNNGAGSDTTSTNTDACVPRSSCTQSSSQYTQPCDPNLYASGYVTVTTTHICDGSNGGTGSDVTNTDTSQCVPWDYNACDPSTGGTWVCSAPCP